MKRILSIIIGVICMAGMTVFAAPIEQVQTEYDYANAQNWKTVLAVSGVIEAGRQNETVTVTVYQIEEENRRMVAVDETYTTEGGSYKITVSLPQAAPAGKYLVKIGAESMAQAEEKEVYLLTASSEAELIEKINLAATAQEIKQLMEPFCRISDYGFATELYLKIKDDAAVYQIMYQQKEKQSFEPKDRQSFHTAWNQAVVLGALQTGTTFDLQSQLQLFPNLDKQILNDYENNLTEEGKQAVFHALSGKAISSEEELEQSMREEIILARISYPVVLGYQNVKDVLETYRDFLQEQGFDMSSYDSGNKDVIARKLIGKYQTLADFKKAFDTAVKEKNTGASGGGGGGGRPSGSSGGNTVQNIDYQPAEGESEQQAKPLPFDDLAEVSWAAESILSLYEKRIIDGDGNGKFFPNDSVTREEFAKMLVLAFELELQGEGADFQDVPADAWYAPYVETLYSNRVTIGIGEDLFGTGRAITRADAAVQLYRVLSARGTALAENGQKIFLDQADIPEYAAEAVERLSSAGVVNGAEDGAFHPNVEITRAEAAKMIDNILQKLM